MNEGVPCKMDVDQSEEKKPQSINISVPDRKLKDEEETDKNDDRKKTNYWETLMHIHKSNTGSGIFAMGDAFKNAGLLLGPVLVFVIGTICVYCQHMMLNVCEETAKRLKLKEPLGFEETSRLCFENGHPRMRSWGRFMGRAVTTFVCITQSGFCCVYIVFISTNVQQVWNFYMPDVHINLMMVFIIIPMIFLSWIQDLKSIAPISTFANLLVTASIVIVVAVAVTNLPDITERRLVSNISTVPLFFGTVIYTFEGIGLVTPIKIKSRTPDKFAAVLGPLNVAMTFLGFLIILLGFVGYWRWGDDVKGSLTLNLDQDSILAQVMKILISLGVLFTYPLQLSPVITNLMEVINNRYKACKHPLILNIAFRTFYTLFLFTLAEAVPHLALFITLVGAFSSSAIGLIIPPIMHIATFYEDYGRFYWKIWKDLSITLLGFLGFVTGTYFSILDIINTFSNPEEVS